MLIPQFSGRWWGEFGPRQGGDRGARSARLPLGASCPMVRLGGGTFHSAGWEVRYPGSYGRVRNSTRQFKGAHRTSAVWWYPRPTGDPGRDRHARSIHIGCIALTVAFAVAAARGTWMNGKVP